MTSNYYIIDSSSLIELNRHNPIDVFPTVWQKIESLISKGFLIAPKEVLYEIIERDDQLGAVTPAEGDWIGLRGTAKGALWVALADGSGDPITSFGGGTQYTEGDTDETITGTAILWEDASHTLATVNASKPLPVDVKSSVGLTVDLGVNNDVTLATLPDTAATDLALQTADLDTIAGDTTSIDGKITACNTGAVVIDSGTVTTVTSITNDVNIADGGNTITIDGTVTSNLSATEDRKSVV